MNIEQALFHLSQNKNLFSLSQPHNPIIGFTFNKKDGFFFVDLSYDPKNKRYRIFITGGHAFLSTRFSAVYASKSIAKLLDELPLRFKRINYDVRPTNREFNDFYDPDATIEHNLYYFFPQIPDPYNEDNPFEKILLQAKQIITDLNQDVVVDFSEFKPLAVC